MVDAGKLAEGSFLEIQAQYAAEELNLVNAENQLTISLLNLQQTLDLPVDTAFDVFIPKLEDPDENPIVMSALEVYRIAEQEMPQIKGAQYYTGKFRKAAKRCQRGQDLPSSTSQEISIPDIPIYGNNLQAMVNP